jgi:hypothetical protein
MAGSGTQTAAFAAGGGGPSNLIKLNYGMVHLGQHLQI